MNDATDYVIALGIPLLAAMVGWLIKSINIMTKQVDDLWKWHAPNDQGRQTWKDYGELLGELRGLVKLLTKKNGA